MKIIKKLPLVLSCLISSCLVFSQTSFAQDKQNILTVDVLSQLNQIQTMVISPDGTSLVYGLKKGINSADNHLYIKDIATGNVRQLTSHKKPESNVKYSADGKSLYFLSARTGSSQIWQLILNGGEARQITDLPLDINGFVVANDEQSFALEITVKPRCTDFECTLAAQDKDKKIRITYEFMTN